MKTDPLCEFTILRPNWLLITSQKTSESSDTYRISDASLPYVRSAKSRGRLRNLCLTHSGSFCHGSHRLLLLFFFFFFFFSFFFFFNRRSFCCVLKSTVGSATILGKKACMYLPQHVVIVPPLIRTEDLVDLLAQRVATQVSLRS